MRTNQDTGRDQVADGEAETSRNVEAGPHTATSDELRQTPIRTLHVDDDAAFATVTADFLELTDDRITVVSAASVDEALERLAADDVDCVVSDYDMPGPNGIEFLRTVRESDPDLPFVLFTGKGSEEVASEAVSAGVTDYLQKEHGSDQYTVLANRIVNVTEKRRAEVDLERRTRQHEAVATLGRLALEVEELSSLFDEAVRLVADRLGTEYAKVLELLPGGDEVALVAGVGWDEGLVGTATVDAGTDSQAGYTLATAEPVVVTDLASETRFGGPDLLVDHGVVSGVSVVVGPAADPWGVLGAHTTAPRAFTDNDVTFVQSVANLLAAAIDRRRAEERRRESEARFREITELSPDGVFRTETDGVFTYVSPAGEELLGRSADELVGTRFDRLVADETLETALEGIARVVAGEVVRGLALTLVDADGEPFDVEVSASPVRRDGEVALVQGFARDVTERNERERALQESRERYRTLVDHFPDGAVFLFDHDLRCTTAGGTELANVGLTADELIGTRPSEVFPPRNAELLESSFRAALAGESRSFEDDYQGSHYHIQVTPLRDDDGAVVAGMAVSRNVTERVEHERALQESRERYRTLVDNFPGGFLLFDHDLRFAAAGGTEFARADLDPATIEGRTLAEILPPEAVATIEPEYRATLDGERRSFDLEERGNHYHVQTIPLRDADGAVVSGMAVAQNVTGQAERERKIDQLRERSQALMHTTTKRDTARVAVDAMSEVIGAPLSSFHAPNDAGDRLEPLVMVEAALDVFDGEPTYHRDAEPGSRAAIMWDVFESGEPLSVDDVGAYDPLDESTPIGTVSVYPIGTHGLFIVAATEPRAYDETDEALVDILLTSLTAAMDRVEREQRLRRREERLEHQNERLQEFASTVSHDLRNPLHVAAGRLTLARRDCESEHLDAVEAAHSRMDELVEGLLTTARHGEPAREPESVSLATVAEAAWALVETPGATFHVDTDRVVVADRRRLQQALENLFRNAVEHGSTVTVTVGDLDATPEDGGTPTADARVGFYVEDDGPGIPVEDRDRVFEVGYSTTARGTGYGLSIVSTIADEHGWRLRATAGAEGGARIEFADVDVVGSGGGGGDWG
jgi:PAS domain S-box-containing protein